MFGIKGYRGEVSTSRAAILYEGTSINSNREFNRQLSWHHLASMGATFCASHEHPECLACVRLGSKWLRESIRRSGGLSKEAPEYLSRSRSSSHISLVYKCTPLAPHDVPKPVIKLLHPFTCCCLLTALYSGAHRHNGFHPGRPVGILETPYHRQSRRQRSTVHGLRLVYTTAQGTLR